MAKTQISKSQSLEANHIGEHEFSKISFPKLIDVIASFKKKDFKKHSARKRFQYVNEKLLELIDGEPKESFLLSAVLEYVDEINKNNILNDRYHISMFEFWLNLFSGLDSKKNYEIRAKIIGKHIPRDDYQAFFPIGMDKVFGGSHFVAAHLSPDVDTMVASFWGWMDAFGGRVSSAQHLWSLPGGPPASPVTQTFYDLFGPSIFANAAHTSLSLTLKALDLVTQKGFAKKKGNASISSIDLSASEKAIILVDEHGHYLGDWHNSDVEPIRKIIIRFKSCLRWFENNLHVKLISLFAKEKLHVKDLPAFLASIFDVTISECEPVKEFTERQRNDLHDFFNKVLGVKNGLNGTFGELIQALALLSVYDLSHFQTELEALQFSNLFEPSGYLREDRPAIFHRLEKLIQQLDNAIHHIRDYAEQLDVAMSIKSKVMGISPQYTTLRSDVEDMRIKLKKYEYITVVVPEDNDKLFPIGVVWTQDLNKGVLGTVSFRDFCNQEEVKMASYLALISVIDHHKTSIKTNSPPNALIADAQSCNVLLAEQNFIINNRYSLGGSTLEEIDAQLEKIGPKPQTPSARRLKQRLIQRQIAAHTRVNCYVHPNRELLEYFSILYAILDDTDLLTKVSKRDIDCLVELLNRIKSLIFQREVEIINLDDIPRDEFFSKEAAKRILHNPDMYSVYRKLYETREREIETYLKLEKSEDLVNLFLDTKEQNGCCRVGQTKLFSGNFSTFHRISTAMMEYWLKNAKAVNHNHPEIDLHLHMISTIPSSAEVYEDRVGKYNHKDQIWFWLPNTQKAYDHLSSFLTAFTPGQKMNGSAEIEFLHGVPEDVIQIFNRDFNAVPQKISSSTINLPIIILHIPAGTVNSRKAMITPYLPRLVP